MHIFHKISHWLGTYYGTVESFYIGEVLWTGFKCSICHEINGAQANDFRFSYLPKSGE